MPIPKIIHTVWVGPNPLSPVGRRCIESWRKHLPDYELVLWNEKNSPIDHPYVREMYKRGKWAFVSDYIRFRALYERGGLYLDADMEVLKPLDRFLADRLFFGRQSSDGFIGSAIIGATAGHPLIKKILEEYDRRADFDDPATSPQTITKVYENSPDKEDVTVYDPQFFYPCNAGERCTEEKLKDACTNHHWDESWVSFRRLRKFLRRLGALQIMKKGLFTFVKFLVKNLSGTVAGTAIGKIPGVLSIYQSLYKSSAPRGIILIRCQGHKMRVNAEDTGIVPDLLAKGVYEPFETELLQRLLMKSGTVVNIGANIGYYTLIAAERVGPHGRVYAFEPEPENYRLLVRNIGENGYKNVVPLQAAVSDKKGTLRLFLDKSNLGNHSLAEKNTDEKNGFVEVETDSLDHFIGKYDKELKVDLIQMDAQGAEGLILDGAKKIMGNARLKIIMEFWPYGLDHTGTDALELLTRLREEHRFTIGLIDERKKRIDYAPPSMIVERCRNSQNGKGFVNLLLEKQD